MLETSEALQSRSNLLRKELKQWESTFAASHEGRKATRDEIKIQPEIGKNNLHPFGLPRADCTLKLPNTRNITESVTHSPARPSPHAHPLKLYESVQQAQIPNLLRLRNTDISQHRRLRRMIQDRPLKIGL